MSIVVRITDAGRAALVNAQRDGTAAVRIASAGVSPTAVAASPGATVLPGEVKRIATISGGATAADVIHLTVRDESADTYTVRSFALYLSDGTLFAIYGQGDPIIEKSSAALLLLAIDATLVDVSAGQITFGDANFMNPAATTETSGIVELATEAEAAALVDARRALTPKGLAAVFTAANILARLVQVDGEGSGLDGDLLDGRHGAWYADIPGRLGFTPVQQATGIGQLGNVVRIGWSGARLKLTIDNDDHGQFVLDKDIIDIWRASNDGAGSGLDADLLDGFHASAFAQLAGAAFTGPVSADGTIVAKSNLASYAPINPRSFDAASQIIAGEPSRNPAFRTTLGYYLSGDQWRGVLNAIADGRGAPLDIQASGGITTFGGPVDIAGALTQGGAQVYHTGNDGAGSGLDADLLDGREGAWFADIAARLGYTPIQQGTGIGQLGNIVRIGWSGSRLKATVDNTDHGPLVFDKDIADIWRASNDGAGSGLDADLLDGLHASAFARLTGAAFTGPVSADGTIVAKSNLASYAPVNPRSFDAASQIIAGEPSRNPAFRTTLGYYLSGDQWRGTVNAIADGKGAPLDIQASGGITTFGGPADIAARLGYTPIQQGTGVGQLGNIVRIGWSGARLKATVDNTDHGPIVFDQQIADVWRASNDGAGSGLDADLLDGRDGAWFADIAARLGYTPIQQGTGVGQVGNIVRIGWSGYLRNPVAQRAVRMVAGGLADAPLAASHPELVALVAARSEGQALLETVATHLLLHGNAYVQILRDAEGDVVELFALRPERVTMELDASGWPAAYLYRAGGRATKLSVDPVKPQVIHVKSCHPLDDHYGLGCLGAAAGAIAIHNAAAAWNRALLDNAARPSGALVYDPGDGSTLTPDQFERLRAEMEGFAGSGNAGRPLLLEGGLKWQAMSLTPAELDFIAAKASAAREIALAFGVPPMLLGLPGDNTYANYREANRALWRQAILPLAGAILSGLAQGLAGWFENANLSVDINRVTALAEERQMLWAMAGSADFLDPAEKRAMVGLS